MIDLATFGQRLRHFRRQRRLTLDGLGEKVGKPGPYLSNLENGKREPKLSLVEALADALDIDAAELLDPTPPSRRDCLLEWCITMTVGRPLTLVRLSQAVTNLVANRLETSASTPANRTNVSKTISPQPSSPAFCSSRLRRASISSVSVTSWLCRSSRRRAAVSPSRGRAVYPQRDPTRCRDVFAS